VSTEQSTEEARTSGGTSPEDRRAALRESLPGLLFALFTLLITAVGVILMISATLP
jgi:hypothetical protein